MIEKLKFLISFGLKNITIVYRAALTIIIMLLIITFYLAINSRQSVISKRQLINDFQQTKKRVLQYQSLIGIHATVSDNSLSLLASIEQSALQFDLSSFITQVQQTDAHHVNLNFNAVPFDRLIIWLQQLTIAYDVNLEKISAIKLNQPGVVKAVVLLSR